MKIELNRYFGNEKVTKSIMKVFMPNSTTPSLVCEARETTFLNYSASFKGWMSYCLPEGNLCVRVRPTEISPLTVALGTSSHQCKFLIAWHDRKESLPQRVLIGDADASIPEPNRKLTNQFSVFERFTDLVRKNYLAGEGIEVVVKNSLNR